MGRVNRIQNEALYFKTMIIAPAMGRDGRFIRSFISHKDDGHQYCIMVVIMFANITKIMGRTRGKINVPPVLRRNRIFEEREFNFINKFKEDFEYKS